MPAGQPFTRLCRQLARPVYAGRADLHLHSTASDGLYTAEQIADLACRSGLSAVALTDHDTFAGIAALQRAAFGRDLEVIPGVEITAEFQGRELHLLGLFVALDHEPLNLALANLRRERALRFESMLERLRPLGLTLAETTLPENPERTLGRRHLAEMLVRAKKVANVREAFQRYLSDLGHINVVKARLPVGEAIALVQAAGGVAAWAHPPASCTRQTLHELAALGMHAVEADFPSCRPSRSTELRLWARELGLAVTGGSDCHGPGEPRRAPGACGVTAAELSMLRARSGGRPHGVISTR